MIEKLSLKEIFDSMEEYLIEVHLPFMLRSVDDKTGEKWRNFLKNLKS